MNEQVALTKIANVMSGATAVMSDAELDWLIDQERYPAEVVSIHNPKRVGLLDVYLVAHKAHPVMQAERAKLTLLESATRSPSCAAPAAWDEPVGASSPRGWYWPKGSTKQGETLCAGHYLDYGPDHYRFDELQEVEPGNIHCVVIAKSTGRAYASRYVDSVEAARAWIEKVAVAAGHSKT